MEKFVYLNELFDIYGELLTEKQRKYFMDYYFDNLSYGEIANNYQVSRNAIFHQLKLIEEKLNFYEDKLRIYQKKQQINDIIKMENDKRIKDKLTDLL